MEEKDKVRLDKWLWSVRMYKTRNKATEACRKGRIMINGTEAKPSREIKRGDTVFIRKLPVVYTIRVKELVENRLPAKRIQEFYEDITNPEELEKLKLKDMAFFKRDRGTGRPTKRERRLLNEIINQE
ncbi:MAG: RNA-binding S4 domain-containing protein [Bacteroidales bacterium]|nr:RNA-binding S4 domain-containing protein [Bacteroidales bacterium]